MVIKGAPWRTIVGRFVASSLAGELVEPFARAVYMMFLVVEAHLPFDGGNGRIGPMTMNAELVAEGDVRIIIPIVYRGNYLSALKGASRNGGYRALIRA